MAHSHKEAAVEDKQAQHEHNAFDELGGQVSPEEAELQKREQQAQYDKIENLIHRTFEQNEAGKELLAIWAEALLVTPGALPGMDNIQVGIIEGRKAFIRNIILTIRKVTNG